MDTENLEPEVEVEENVTPEIETSEEVIEESHLEETTDEGEFIADDAGAETLVEPAYEPNYSFRAGEEEYEMDEWLQSKITSKEDEDRFRDLAERAHGLEVLKEQREHLRGQNQNFEQIESQRQGAVSQLQSYVDKNEWEPFQKTWGITDDQLLNRAVEIMQLRELPPEQQQAYYSNVQAREQNEMLQQQNQQLQQQHSQIATGQRNWELDSTLQHENFSNAAQTFDERAGRPGAFRDEIIKRGQYYAKFHQRDVPPHVLAQELLPYVGGSQQAAPAQAGNRQVIRSQNKPTLPRIAGSGASPIKASVNSIADIKARAAELASG